MGLFDRDYLVPLEVQYRDKSDDELQRIVFNRTGGIERKIAFDILQSRSLIRQAEIYECQKR